LPPSSVSLYFFSSFLFFVCTGLAHTTLDKLESIGADPVLRESFIVVFTSSESRGLLVRVRYLKISLARPPGRHEY